MTRKRFPIHIVVFLAPATLVYTLFMIYPLVDSLRLSLFAPSPENPRVEVFVGLQNYQTLFTDPNYAPRLQGAVVNNFIFFTVHMLVQNPVGLLLATLLTSQLTRFRAFFRTAIFMPTMLSFVLVGFIWGNIILSPLWGIADDFFRLVGLGALIQPWLGQPQTALVTLSLVSVWQFVGIPMMLFSAALIGIPDELIEAARVDGATGWGVFWRIKFPLILPTVGIVTILTFVGNFNAFDLIYTVQGGLAGPNYSTDILGTFFYRTFFGFQLQPGNPTMGATIAGVMFLIILTGVLLYLFGFQRRIVRVEY
ncbi:MAG: carbohydrate ABC transporter permease [Candidatus Flexifilum sp.]|jgi:raffinose/stachyose/melibiose transport system permease protein